MEKEIENDNLNVKGCFNLHWLPSFIFLPGNCWGKKSSGSVWNKIETVGKICRPLSPLIYQWENSEVKEDRMMGKS